MVYNVYAFISENHILINHGIGREGNSINTFARTHGGDTCAHWSHSDCCIMTIQKEKENTFDCAKYNCNSTFDNNIKLCYIRLYRYLQPFFYVWFTEN